MSESVSEGSRLRPRLYPVRAAIMWVRVCSLVGREWVRVRAVRCSRVATWGVCVVEEEEEGVREVTLHEVVITLVSIRLITCEAPPPLRVLLLAAGAVAAAGAQRPGLFSAH